MGMLRHMIIVKFVCCPYCCIADEWVPAWSIVTWQGMAWLRKELLTEQHLSIFATISYKRSLITNKAYKDRDRGLKIHTQGSQLLLICELKKATARPQFLFW